MLIGAGLVVVAGWGFLALYDIDVWGYIRRGYETRPFTLFERVLTQPRVLLFYLSQLFYPIPQRLSLEHDVAVSTCLINPWSTLPAMLVVASLVGFAVVRARQQPMASLAILFFFSNHLVESSMLPLEMVFEHRNYLPSLFLFWPVVGAVFRFQPLLSPSSESRVKALPAALMAVVLLFGLGTFMRNMDWQSERRLWMDAYHKAPGSARAAVNLAIDLARAGEYQTAMALYRHSLTLSAPRKNHFRIIALSNMGNLEFMFGRYAAAVELFEAALALEPDNLRSRYNLATAYTEGGGICQGGSNRRGTGGPISWCIPLRQPRGLYCVKDQPPGRRVGNAAALDPPPGLAAGHLAQHRRGPFDGGRSYKGGLVFQASLGGVAQRSHDFALLLGEQLASRAHTREYPVGTVHYGCISGERPCGPVD